MPLETDEALDYSVLEVFGDRIRDFGRLELSVRDLGEGDPFWVIGHPMVEAQRISREQCRAASPAVSAGRMRHTCGTLPGNSGSPVIEASPQQVVALHFAGSSRVNFAVPMGLILEQSGVLTATPPPEARTETPDAAEAEAEADAEPEPGEETVVEAEAAGPGCRALYRVAQETDACYGYRAFLDICGDDAYAVFARGHIEEACTEDVSQAEPARQPDPKPKPEQPASSSVADPEPETPPQSAYLPEMLPMSGWAAALQ